MNAAIAATFPDAQIPKASLASRHWGSQLLEEACAPCPPPHKIGVALL